MFDYNVSIKGLENIALRTDRPGAIKLIDAFDQEKLTPFVIEQVDAGNPFANNLISISIVPKPVVKAAAHRLTDHRKAVQAIQVAVDVEEEDAEFIRALVGMEDNEPKKAVKKAVKVARVAPAKKVVKKVAKKVAPKRIQPTRKR